MEAVSYTHLYDGFAADHVSGRDVKNIYKKRISALKEYLDSGKDVYKRQGYEAAKEIRLLDHPDASAIPIIAMSADTFSEDIQHCLECGMNAHIAKPVDIKELVGILKKYLK